MIKTGVNEVKLHSGIFMRKQENRCLKVCRLEACLDFIQSERADIFFFFFEALAFFLRLWSYLRYSDHQDVDNYYSLHDILDYFTSLMLQEQGFVFISRSSLSMLAKQVFLLLFKDNF